MTDNEVVEIMIHKVEDIVREKAQEDFDATKPSDRKIVSKTIINELEKVLKNEN